jgi:hypothetical protein
MKPWQWLCLALLVCIGLAIPMTEDAPKGQEEAVEVKGSVMPEGPSWP